MRLSFCCLLLLLPALGAQAFSGQIKRFWIFQNPAAKQYFVLDEVRQDNVQVAETGDEWCRLAPLRPVHLRSGTKVFELRYVNVGRFEDGSCKTVDSRGASLLFRGPNSPIDDVEVGYTNAPALDIPYLANSGLAIMYLATVTETY